MERSEFMDFITRGQNMQAAVDEVIGGGGALTPARLGRLLLAWAGALEADAFTAAETVEALRDLGGDLVSGRVSIQS